MRIWLLTSVLVASVAACATMRRDPLPLSVRLASADTLVRWVVDSALVADFDCDGLADSAFVGRAPERISVGIVRGSAPTPTIISFGVHGSRIQEHAGSADAILTLESIDYDPKEDIGELEGFRQSSTCKGLNLGDGDSDAMHLYWNHKTGALDWWRR